MTSVNISTYRSPMVGSMRIWSVQVFVSDLLVGAHRVIGRRRVVRRDVGLGSVG